MNASLRFATFVACWVVLALVQVSAYGQTQNAAARPSSGDRIAVIDINHIFKNHVRFKAMVEDWKTEVKRAEAEMKGKSGQMERMVEDLKRFDPGSQKYKEMEEAIAKQRGALQVEMQIKKKDLMIREAKMYLKVYEEVQMQVAYFSQQKGITLVLRFSRENVNSEDPRQIQAGLLRTVVFQDRIDITLDILQRLNPPGGQSPVGNLSPRNQAIPQRR